MNIPYTQRQVLGFFTKERYNIVLGNEVFTTIHPTVVNQESVIGEMVDDGLMTVVNRQRFNQFEIQQMRMQSQNFDQCVLYKLTEEGELLLLYYEM